MTRAWKGVGVGEAHLDMLWGVALGVAEVRVDGGRLAVHQFALRARGLSASLVSLTQAGYRLLQLTVLLRQVDHTFLQLRQGAVQHSQFLQENVTLRIT